MGDGDAKGYQYSSRAISADPTMADERSVYQPAAREQVDATATEKRQPADTANGKEVDTDAQESRQHIAFDVSAEKHAHPKNDATLYIPGPRERDHGRLSMV